MLSCEKAKEHPKRFRACTSLDIAEFEQLLPHFERSWNIFVDETFIQGKERQRQYGGGRKATLAKMEDKLFFILFYFKTYPLQEVLGLLFGISQSQVNVWVHRLSNVLRMTLGMAQYLPERDPANLEAVLAQCDGLEFMIDGTERRIQRPSDLQQQKKYYSGKKKTHTCKNNIIVDAFTRQVEYLSQTYEGKKSDKKICDEEGYIFPAKSLLHKDKGFQGYEPEGVITFQPRKKPRGQELPLADRFFNRVMNSVRIIVEHIISGIKRCRIVKDIFRNTKTGFDDLVMDIACGLHNLRTTCRQPHGDGYCLWLA
jgi:hypothetical protein